MANPYKLTEEVKQFIIQQKKQNPKLSCRGLIPLIRKHFRVSLSKSLINNVIKQNNLSSPARKRKKEEPAIKEGPVIPEKKEEPAIKEGPVIPEKKEEPAIKEGPVIPQQPIGTQEVKKKEEKFILPLKKDTGFIDNGGYLFLKAVDLKLSLTLHLAENLSVYFPNLSTQSLQRMIEALAFMPLFKNRSSLWLFIGKEISLDGIYQYSKQLVQISLAELNNALMKSGFNYKLNEINELHKRYLQGLSSYVQVNFFPSAYQFLEFPTMQERFYSLWANIKRTDKFLDIQFFYPDGFRWRNDIVWREDLSYAVNKVNESRIFTQEEEQIRVSSQVEILPANLA